jgi:hypothetical protein
VTVPAIVAAVVVIGHWRADAPRHECAGRYEGGHRVALRRGGEGSRRATRTQGHARSLEAPPMPSLERGRDDQIDLAAERFLGCVAEDVLPTAPPARKRSPRRAPRLAPSSWRPRPRRLQRGLDKTAIGVRILDTCAASHKWGYSEPHRWAQRWEASFGTSPPTPYLGDLRALFPELRAIVTGGIGATEPYREEPRGR